MTSKVIKPDYHTIDGNPIWLRFPWRSRFTLKDIERSMCGIRRYNGGLDCRLVTHSNLVAELILQASNNPIAAGYGAWHDAQEALVQDLIHGIKEQLPEYKYQIEPPWEERIMEFIGLDPAQYPQTLVCYYDRRALLVEMKYYGHARYEHKVKEWNDHSAVTDAEIEILHAHHKASPEVQWNKLLRTVTTAAKLQEGIHGKNTVRKSHGNPRA